MTTAGYQETDSASRCVDGTPPPAHYHYVVVPPAERLLLAIGDHCGVGGTIRPRNRTLADWASYQSAGHVGELLDQLACDGWIQYDRATGLITLLFDPMAGSADPEADQLIPRGIDSEDDADSALIPSGDRVSRQQDAESESIPSGDQNAPRMEDHVLVAATVTQDSAAARSKIPCSAESIPVPDHPDHRAVLLSELGADAKIIADALRARPDLTPEQIRASWAHFEPRIKAGLCTAGAFFKAIRRGQLHTAPPDPDRPLDPASYAERDGFALGSQAPPEVETIRDHAARLLPVPTAATIREHTRDWMFLQCRLGAGDSDDQALAALADYRKAVRR